MAQVKITPGRVYPQNVAIYQANTLGSLVAFIGSKHAGRRIKVDRERLIDRTYGFETSTLSIMASSSLQSPTAALELPTTAPQVVLTRERGKNDQLAAALAARGVSTLELPLVETRTGPDQATLSVSLREETFEWVTITSPEAAAVFLKAWRIAGSPTVNVAVVGSGTGRCLKDEDGPLPAFVPSTANAVHLASELPRVEGGNGRVLYPSSAKAGSDLEAGLRERGFDVVRLNTYDTVAVEELPEVELELARRASVIAFASPSAVKAWRRLTGPTSSAQPLPACIGSTSAQAASKLGYSEVYFPSQPGIEGFVTSIMEALEASSSLQQPVGQA
eukprot:jgi/Botrbrau1/11759/Bobra.0195s0084.1